MPLFVLAHFTHHMLTALPTPLLPFIRDEFALDYAQIGFIISAFSLSYGISQLPAGWLSNRIGSRLVIAIGISGVALFGLLVGISQTYTMMIVLLVLMGIAAGGYHPTAPTLISAAIETGKRGRALGFHAIGGSASYFLVPLIAAAMASAWGWRSPFIVLAIPTLILGLVFYVLLGKRALSTTYKKEHHLGSDTVTPPARGYLRSLVPFTILSTLSAAITFSVASFIPLFLVDHFGVSRETAASLLALLYSAGFWAAPLGGYLADRLSRVKIILAIGFLSGAVIYLLNLASYSAGIAAVLIGMGMLNYIRMPVSEFYIITETPERHRSMLLSIYYFAGMEGIGIFTPVVGYFIDRFGFNAAFTYSGVTLGIVTLVCSLFLWKARD